MSEHKIPLAGVIGSPVAHSKSPRLHGFWLRKYGIAGYYVPLHVEPSELQKVVRTLPNMGFVGANVTIPHKEAILQIADEVTDTAKMIGAANTLVFQTDGRILADNTDAYGFIENLRQGAPNWTAENSIAVVLGAGGAARAVIASLLQAGVSQIVLGNRTAERAEILAKSFGPKIKVVDWAHLPEYFASADLLVNTTSLGMVGKPSLSLPLNTLTAKTVVTDIVYTPLETPLLAHAREVGSVTVDGLGMLLHQAVPGFERWFGTRPEVDAALRSEILG